jgi:hypothetical protein
MSGKKQPQRNQKSEESEKKHSVAFWATVVAASITAVGTITAALINRQKTESPKASQITPRAERTTAQQLKKEYAPLTFSEFDALNRDASKTGLQKEEEYSRWAGKYVIWSGFVMNVSRIKRYNGDLMMVNVGREKDGPPAAALLISDADVLILKSLKLGDQIEFEGKFEGEIAGSTYLNEGRILRKIDSRQ